MRITFWDEMLSPMKSLWTLVRLDAMFEIFELEVCIITKLSAMWSNSCSPTLSSVHLYYRLVFTPSFTPVSSSRRLVLTISQSLGLFKWAWNCFVVFWNWRAIFSYSAVCTWILCVCKVGTSGESEREWLGVGLLGLLEQDGNLGQLVSVVSG